MLLEVSGRAFDFLIKEHTPILSLFLFPPSVDVAVWCLRAGAATLSSWGENLKARMTLRRAEQKDGAALVLNDTISKCHFQPLVNQHSSCQYGWNLFWSGFSYLKLKAFLNVWSPKDIAPPVKQLGHLQCHSKAATQLIFTKFNPKQFSSCSIRQPLLIPLLCAKNIITHFPMVAVHITKTWWLKAGFISYSSGGQKVWKCWGGYGAESLLAFSSLSRIRGLGERQWGRQRSLCGFFSRASPLCPCLLLLWTLLNSGPSQITQESLLLSL